jgi:carbonic anhydrase
MAVERRNPGPSKLLSDNAKWARNLSSEDPTFFSRTAQEQTPKVIIKNSSLGVKIRYNEPDLQVFWIGCSDSRVPEGVITNAMPGDIFADRNIAK